MGRWNGGYIRNFPLLPFGVPIAPTVLGVGETHPSKVSSLLPFWVTPCVLYGTNSEIWHGSLFTAATAPIGGITLVALYSARAALEWRIYNKFSTFTLWGTHCANGFGGWGDPPIPSFIGR